MAKQTRGTHFSNIEPAVGINRSAFDRSHNIKTTFDESLLIPVFVDEILPGDSCRVNMNVFARLATPLHPILDDLFLESHFFFIPLRLVFTNFQRMMGEQDNPADSIDYTIPQINMGSIGQGIETLYDYMGVDPLYFNGDVSALFFRAYNLTHNHWFRDENLTDSAVVDMDGGPDDVADYVLLKRAKRKDYFTSCLPWPSKGDPVLLPLGTRADVKGFGLINQTYDITSAAVYETGASGTRVYADSEDVDIQFRVEEDPNNAGFPNVYADLTTATAATINQIRTAFAMQRLMERDARGGTRYVELLRSHWNVTSPDFRLQRVEYLGGGSQRINVTPVPQTSVTTDGTGDSLATAQGNLAAYGTSSGTHSFAKSFTEHGIILGLVNVRGAITYQKTVHKMFKRLSKYDHYWPGLQGLGEQAVLNHEIWAQDQATVDGSGDPINDNVFGYQERWAEYRYKPSTITGKMRSDEPTSLDTWHVAEDFTTLPVLNNAFIEDNPALDRVVAVPSEPKILFDAKVDYIHVRAIPVYGTPGNIDRF